MIFEGLGVFMPVPPLGKFGGKDTEGMENPAFGQMPHLTCVTIESDSVTRFADLGHHLFCKT